MSREKSSSTGILTVMYWRDIPAQVIAKSGRTKARRELSRRFQEAIDAAAMKSGAHGTDAYLEGWRKSGNQPCSSDLDTVVDAAVARLETEYDSDRLKSLIAAGGNIEGEA